MTTATLTPSTTAVDTPARRARTITPIPMTRLVRVELRKMFDTRAGFWLVAGIGIVSLLATAAVVIFAPRAELTYETFATAIGAPMSILLPVVAILALTSEWSQRSGLTTFTLVPHRGRVIVAKSVAILGVAVVSMVLAGLIGAVGNVVGTAIAGVDTTWNISLTEFGYIVLANVIGMAIGFMLAVLLRNSAGAIVGYFVYSALLPTISSALASTQDWWRENGPWLDINYASSALYNGSMTGEQWAQLGVTTLVWLWIPLAIGLRAVLRAEVK
jgi:hypothetical protein